MIRGKHSPKNMATRGHLTKAPLTEALIDVRVKARDQFSLDTFRALRSKLASTLPQVEEQNVFQGRVEIGPGRSVSQHTRAAELNGFFFKSADGLTIAQFRKDGFTFNRLSPYTSWEEVFPQAWNLWELYIETGAAEFVTRIALRYVNLLKLPTPVRDLADYLTAPPRTPEGVPGSIASFLTKVVLNNPQTGIAANITQGLENSAEPGSVGVILDIDVYVGREFELRDPSIKNTFVRLRELKNDIFFSSITEDAVRLFK